MAQSTNSILTDTAEVAADNHVSSTAEAKRKAIGQFFTPSVVADFMATRFTELPGSFRLLDAGAGVGTLTAAFCERVLRLPKARTFHADLFEIDPTALRRLKSVLNKCKKHLEEHGHSFTFHVHAIDFALANTPILPLFDDVDRELYDFAIMNPPYFKIGANSDHAKSGQQLGINHPNMYSLFMAAAIQQLKRKGELVAITPRSYCNGRYFRDFRQWLTAQGSILSIHSFASRTETFKEAQVLQESIITHFQKGTKQHGSVRLTRSNGRDFQQLEMEELDTAHVIDSKSGDYVIVVPENAQDSKLLELIEKWPQRFTDTGLQISTGPVVMFRTRDFHVEQLNPQSSVPLFSAHHVRRTGLSWPRTKLKWPEAFSIKGTKHLTRSSNYVFVKRFSSKEEYRRLVASAFLEADLHFKEIAIENHLNFIFHSRRELSVVEVKGIEAIFNSVLFDRYFRTFSGNTQVNATEIRTMKFPSLSTVDAIGMQLQEMGNVDPLVREQVVLDALRIKGNSRRYLEGYFQ